MAQLIRPMGTGDNLSIYITETPPGQVKYLTNIVEIETGEYFSLALRSDGAVWAWGKNEGGQLGNNTTRDSNVPVRVLVK